jgi:hypothetical protein
MNGMPDMGHLGVTNCDSRKEHAASLIGATVTNMMTATLFCFMNFLVLERGDYIRSLAVQISFVMRTSPSGSS